MAKSENYVAFNIQKKLFENNKKFSLIVKHKVYSTFSNYLNIISRLDFWRKNTKKSSRYKVMFQLPE